MADITDSAQPTPKSALLSGGKNLKRRRAAETRLKLYGLTAIGLAFLALVTLLTSVITQASGAVTESYLILDVPLPQDEIDPTGEATPAEIRNADYGSLIDRALEERFPSGEGLDGLISSGAAYELGQQVSENPGMIGGTSQVRLVASDTTSLYLQGGYGTLAPGPSEGALTVEAAEEGNGVALSTTQQDFTEALNQVKAGLTDDAAGLRRRADRQRNAVRVYTERLDEAETEEARQGLQEQLQEAEQARDELVAQAEDLEARAEGAGGAEDLTPESISAFIRAGGGWIKITRMDRDSAEGEVMSPVDLPVRDSSEWEFFTVERPEATRQVSDVQLLRIEQLQEAGSIDRVINWRFFRSADSRAAELAGIWGAVVGSFWTMMVTFFLAFPVGVLAAIYLEEFAPKNRITDFIEVNINNLAAVPSIVFGLLGLAVFLQFFGVPRSSPLAGGIVLALMTLPLIIIASRASIRAVPPSIREAALGVGASNLQTAFHHVLPLAMPGILTGTIIGMAQALGETAPLIMIGMVAFIVDVPSGITDNATVLPVQVFRWFDFPEQAFEAKAGAAICVLLMFLVLMNALAIFLRKRFERRW